ncbi:uncharacterized protein LOC135847459 isoform X2 [Planococcus citri]|uniref:uncharacterized protein LOC135847459 isoform X2 n=1 Tax=Planococcus citri TaxID=170843 RepID=UPI0031F9F15D
MAELTSDMYNTTQSALPTLHKLSASAIALGIWRFKVNEYRTNGSLEKFDPEDIQYDTYDTFRTTFANNLPPAISDLIRKYVLRFAHSLRCWLYEHYSRVFYFHYARANNILYDFDDFVADDYGTIDYAKTAERMMRCDKFGKTKKFKIACAYCFEDDIRRMWPSVCRKIGTHNIRFHHCSELYYWICYLRNEMDFLPSAYYGQGTVDEELLLNCMRHNRPSVEYFWNRIPLESRMEIAERIFTNADKADLAEIILPQLDRHQLDKFVNTQGYQLISQLLENSDYDEKSSLRTWMCMRNVMDESNFKKMIKRSLAFASGTHQRIYIMNERDSRTLIRLSCEIWNSAPHNLKRSMISVILSDLGLYVLKDDYKRDIYTELLLTILSSATTEEKSSFWHNYWHDLILDKKRQDLQRVLELFLENEDAIIEFKQNVLIESQKAHRFWASFLINALFEYLDDLVDFCCSDAQAARHFKQRLLKSSFLGKTSALRDAYFWEGRAKGFDKFISDAFDSDDGAADFKNQLMSSHVTLRRLANLIINRGPWSEWDEFKEFKEIFVPNEELVEQIKEYVIDELKKAPDANRSSWDWYPYSSDSDYHKKVLLWCFGSDEEVEKFKETYGHSYA